MCTSRCGTRCDACAYCLEGKCPGCLKQTQPFWGKCPVKGCCESRGHAHCGLCPDFVCRLAHEFAYDPKEGDGGARLANCRRWAEDAKKNG